MPRFPWAESLPFGRTVVRGDRDTGPPTVTEVPALALSHPRPLSFITQVVALWSFPTPVGLRKFPHLGSSNYCYDEINGLKKKNQPG